MTDDTRTPEEIEREIEERRAALSSNIDDLQDRFSIDTLVRQVGDQFREHGGDMSRSIADQVKANPIPLALTGIGLAWLMMGDARGSASRDRSASHDGGDYDRPRQVRNRSDRGIVGRSVDDGALPSWLHDDFHGQPGRPGSEWRADTSEAGGRSEGVADKVGSALSSASSSASESAASAKSTLSDVGDSMRSGIANARDRLAEGTESLTDEGRARVLAARRKVVDMRREVTRSMGDGSDAATDFYDRQPLVVGALALAVGAALGGALPRTRVEDGLMGERSDALLADAERIFEEEKSKAMAVGKAVTDEVKDIAAETKADLDDGAPVGLTAADALAGKAKAAADRVGAKARTAARDEKLGRPDS